MTIIAGASYKNGLAIAGNGAPYVVGIASTASVPTWTTVTGSGARINPPGLKVNGDGALYVRYV